MRDRCDWHPTPQQLEAFDHGTLPTSEWDAVEGHVAGCACCARRLESVPDDPLTALLKTSASPPLSRTETSDPDVQGAGSTSPDTDIGESLPPELREHPRYRVLGFLGAGGMGAVFRAEHRLMQRAVALKVLHRDVTDRPTAIERFRQEVRAVASLSHPNIVA